MKSIFKNLAIFFAVFGFLVFSILPASGFAVELTPSQFEKIDGQPVKNSLKDHQVVGIVVNDQFDQEGKPILYGFTQIEGFHKYLEKSKKSANLDANRAYFYEHIDRRGASFSLKVGTSSSYVGNSWNDRISSVIPACTGNWTVLYEHKNYGGKALAIENSNNMCRYYFNLTDVQLSNGKSWNDQVSSIRVY